jgi:prepilin-type N-terminal cleavage/methylation domain-containing protein
MSNQRGFTLLEVALALAIIGITLIPAANMWLAVSQASIATEQLALATNLAQRTLESRIRNVPFEDQQPATGLDPQTALRYTLTIASESIPGHSTPTLRRVEVTVSSPDSATPIVQLITLTAKENTL